LTHRATWAPQKLGLPYFTFAKQSVAKLNNSLRIFEISCRIVQIPRIKPLRRSDLSRKRGSPFVAVM
jgi:hypothetical protein